MRRVGVAGVVATLIALTATGLLLLARDQLRQRQEANSRAIAAVAVSQLDQDPELSLLLGLKARDASKTPQATEALRAGLVTTRGRRTLQGHSRSITPIAYTPDGRRVITASNDGNVRIWNARTGRPGLMIRTGAPVRDMDLSDDGRRLATASGPRTDVWSTSTGRRVAPALMTRRDSLVTTVDLSSKATWWPPEALTAGCGSGGLEEAVAWSGTTARRSGR